MDVFEGLEPALPFRSAPHLVHHTTWLAQAQAFQIGLEGAELLLAPTFLSKQDSDRTLRYLLDNPQFDPINTHWPGINDQAFAQIPFKHIAWQRQSGRFYGKELRFARMTAWYGEAEAIYRYSGQSAYPLPWNEGLLALKSQVEQLCECRFNSVLLNWYRDGHDHLSWHADDEKELGQNAVIASLSLGATRDFLIRRADDHRQKLVMPLAHGSLLVMRGAMQKYWQHAVPKRRRVAGSRVNLTFRWIQPTPLE